MSRKVFVFDTTLRDGVQSPGASLNPVEKLKIAKQLARLNVDVIEGGMPVSSPQDVEAVRAIAEEVKGPITCALARCVEEDIVSAASALEPAIQVGKALLHVFLGVSDIHLAKQLKRTRAEALKMVEGFVAHAKTYCPEVEFSPMDATRADFGYLCEVVQAAIEAGATVINIPDTVGYAVPRQFGQLITNLQRKIPALMPSGGVRLSIHCHDDLGNATANTCAAVRAGATQVEVAMNNMGERAGNAALEEVVMNIRERLDYYQAFTGINVNELVNTSRLVSRLMGFVVPPNKAIVGVNAGKHSSGVHQDGVLKEPKTFELFNPKDVGHNEQAIVLTAQSGRHALVHRLEELGYEVPSELNEVYEQFLNVAGAKKEVHDDDLRAIMGDALSTVPQMFSLGYFCSKSGTDDLPSASVGLHKPGQTGLVYRTATGDGPVDAVYKAIDKITGLKVELANYSLHGVTGGKDAMGEVIVRVQANGRTVVGRGVSTDIVEASAKAYLDAVNKLLADQKPAFSPQMIAGSRTGLTLIGTYVVPKCPDGKVLLAGVKAGWIAFFYVDADALPETEEPYKTGRGWQYYIVPEGTAAVKFPQYQVEDHSDANLYGRPSFIKL